MAESKRTRVFIENNYNSFEDEYWNCFDRLSNKKKDLEKIQNEYNSLLRLVEEYDNERKFYLSLLNELDGKTEQQVSENNINSADKTDDLPF